MARLKILADGKSEQAQAPARGKLFEKLMALVLRHFGYDIVRNPNVNYAGMELDIEGKAMLTQIPIYAECKCHETDLSAPDLQAFLGKYITRWFKDNRCQGLFIALPGINSHARGFYRENCEQNPQFTFKIIEEEQVLTALHASNIVADPIVFAKAIDQSIGTPGDLLILYTDKGCFGIQYIIPVGDTTANSLAVFDAKGNSIASSETIDYLIQLYPELQDFNQLSIDSAIPLEKTTMKTDIDQIAEVRGSSSYFEYQFPASAEHFVGRESILQELDSFAFEVIEKKTSSRGVVFEANSGWGKSSVVLASVARLRKRGHFAVAIDSRTASTSQFILRAVDYALNNSNVTENLSAQDHKWSTITGFDGAVDALVKIGRTLESNRKLLFIFLDQFENIFFLVDALSRIRDLFIKVTDAQTNIVFGFSWKTDLVGFY